ncbi:MAG: dihydrolipoyl dehydrogenase [Clostridiales bacterium]|nr:dihydrolipoyl dehydrogenase [Clostridiales bacterium]
MERYDLIVIGGGPGGYLAAERAAAGGMMVALFEKRALGGVCLNEGCIPTKSLLHCAKLYRHATESEAFGVSVTGAKYDHKKAVARKDRVVKTLTGGIEAAMKAAGVTVIKSAVKISGRAGDGFVVEDAEGEKYTAARLCVATGSETALPPIPGLFEGLASGFVKTNREILDMKELPQSLVVIGGGVVGLEMACYFNSVGVDVTVIELSPKIAGDTNAEICRVLMNEYGRRGMKFRLSCRVRKIDAGAVTYEEKDGGMIRLECDTLLLAAGRRPVTEGVGLETLGVECSRGAAVTDSRLCTNVPGVYAVGDCNGRMMLAHTAYREAEVAVAHMLGKKDEMRYDHIPSVIYTDPEVASAGESKESATAKGYTVREVKIPMTYAGRYVAEAGSGAAFCKLVYDTARERLVGVHMIGPYASEMIYGAALMLDTELPLARLQKLVFPHPTVSEIIREALLRL